ncbi:MAG: hypothetical protein PWP04_852 [Candidatus Atribacteria bacterium]|nr:hypothetical protein [Candidatus Atribacteria bacterium]
MGKLEDREKAQSQKYFEDLFDLAVFFQYRLFPEERTLGEMCSLVENLPPWEFEELAIDEEEIFIV